MNWHGKVPFVALLLILLVFVIVATEPALVLFIVFALYALAGPINTFRTVDKVTLNDVVGDHEEDADFAADKEAKSDKENESEGTEKP